MFTFFGHSEIFRDEFSLDDEKVTFWVESQDKQKPPGTVYTVTISKPKAARVKGRSPLRRYPGRCSCGAGTKARSKAKLNHQATKCKHVATVYGHFFSICD